MQRPAFKIVIAYETFASGMRAKGVSERLAAQLETEFDINSDVWKFDMLRHSRLREQAATDAAEADMIIISVGRAPELPTHVSDWVESWLPRKKGGQAALVALLDQHQEADGDLPPLATYLQEMAEKGSMDFFCKAGDWREQLFENIIEDKPHPNRRSSKFEEALHRDSWRGWGINE